MLELEKTYLAKYIPEELKSCVHKEVVDIYVPKSSRHPQIRIRKDGNNFIITKKVPGSDESSSSMIEETINLTEGEYNELTKLEGKRVSKKRYLYNYEGRIAEIDIFLEGLEGLVLVDFEFESEADMKNFKMPDFCLADVTDEEFIAGGMLCGKTYSDIEKELTRFNYSKL